MTDERKRLEEIRERLERARGLRTDLCALVVQWEDESEQTKREVCANPGGSSYKSGMAITLDHCARQLRSLLLHPEFAELLSLLPSSVSTSPQTTAGAVGKEETNESH